MAHMRITQVNFIKKAHIVVGCPFSMKWMFFRMYLRMAVDGLMDGQVTDVKVRPTFGPCEE